MAQIVTFGEIMLRLAPNGYYRFFQNDQFQATFGGAEANVAQSLAILGKDAAFVTALPDHAIGQAAIDSMRAFGVDTDEIIRTKDRIGVYYLEKGASQRPSVCIYDRKNSAIANVAVDAFDWGRIFDGAKWFHFTGITPALSENLYKICLIACKKAKEKGIVVSLDPNFRSKLWSKEDASKAIKTLLPYVDVLMTNPGDTFDLLGIRHGERFDGQTDDVYEAIAADIAEKYGVKTVALTLRTQLSASRNLWKGMIYDKKSGKSYFSREYDLVIVDRVGGGDSFDAGIIYGMTEGENLQGTIDFAVAASALKHSIEGDVNRVTASEIKALAAGDGSGRVKR